MHRVSENRPVARSLAKRFVVPESREYCPYAATDLTALAGLGKICLLLRQEKMQQAPHKAGNKDEGGQLERRAARKVEEIHHRVPLVGLITRPP
jgi:hypothetical protein